MTIELTELANGLRVVSHVMPHLETASLGIWVHTGARAELPHEHGLAHFLEHMAFKGTPRRDARRIAEEIEAVGGSINAATSFESTDYFARVLKEDVPLALDILSDILQNPLFDQDELEREKQVVLQEIAAIDDSPDDLVFELVQQTAYPDQPLGRPILGTKSTVRSFRAEHLITYRQDTYAAPRMVLGAAGAVDHGALVKAAETLLCDLNRTAARESEPGRYVGGHGRLKRRFEQCQLVIAFEAPSYREEGYYAANIYASLLGGGISSRLFQQARERRGLCYDIHSFYGGYSDTGLFGVHAATGPEQVRALTAVIRQELEAVAAHGPETGEMQRARAQLKSGLLMSLESSEARAGQIARDTLVFGRPLTTAELIARIEAVTPDHVRELAQRFLTAAKPTSASVGPRGVSEKLQELAESFSLEAVLR